MLETKKTIHTGLMEVYNRAFESEIPIAATIELTSKCNWRCKHCYLPSHNNNGLSTQKVKDIFQQLRDMGVYQLTLTGGEMFTRGDILEIITYARKLGFQVSILSNASLITREIAQYLKELYINFFSLTIFSLNPGIHDSITKVKGSMKAALRGANFLAEAGISVDIKTPLMIDNWNEFSKLKAYCEKHGYTYMASSFIFQKTDGSNDPLALTIRGEKLNKIVEKIDKINGEATYKVSEEYMCNLLKYSLALNSEGDVYPCNGFYRVVGNINTHSIKQIWNNEEYKFIRNLKKKSLEKCQSCSLIKECERCPGTAYMETGNYYGCSNICKEIALARNAAKIDREELAPSL